MNHHEREFFIYKIRSGNVYLEDNIVIKAPTLEQNIEACFIYNKTYQESFDDDVMTEDEMIDWMIEHGLWAKETEEEMEKISKDIETLKVEMFNARNKEKVSSRLRLILREAEKQLTKRLMKKNMYRQNTCEGIAHNDKMSWLVKNTTYKNDKRYKFDDLLISEVLNNWYSDQLQENIIRELARNEPWRTIWSTSEKARSILFINDELTSNQKNLLLWSQTYDSIQESMDCPTEEVIGDDDMLDGWFILQTRKRKQEKSQADFESTTNEKIKNSDEIYIMSDSKKNDERIHEMNDVNAKMIKKQRAAVITKKGSAEQHEFRDEILRIKSRQTEMYKGNFKGGR